MDSLRQRVLVAQGDAWQVQGRLRQRLGGGACELPGVRLMSSGLQRPYWNTGVVTDAGAVDVAAVRAWYAARAGGAGVPWGLLVPAGQPFASGRWLRARRCMALEPPAFVPARGAAGVALRIATEADVERVVAIDSAAFEEPVEQNRAWVSPQVGAAGFTVALASLGGEAVGIATAIQTGSAAGRCVGIYGVAVLAHARRRGIGATITAWLLARAFARGAMLAHLNPDTEAAARLYARLGFVEVDGFDIYADV